MSGICVCYYISSSKFHGMCVSSIHTFWYIDMPDVTTSYGRFSSLIGSLKKNNVRYVIVHQTFINFVESS